MIKGLLLALALAGASTPTLASDWSKMPRVEMPVVAPSGDTLVIFYSGDAGWSPLARDVSAAFVQAGVPVVGVDSLRYYWRRRTPEGAAGDLAGLIEHFTVAWTRSRVILVGYSFGADALPMLLERLPADARTQVQAMVLISPADRAHLAFRFASWFDIPLPGGYLVAPALRDDKATPVLCIQATDDPRAACRSFPPDAAQSVVVLPGGHRYGRERPQLAALILKTAGLTPGGATVRPIEPTGRLP